MPADISFLEQLMAAPELDEPRLRYAAWLDGRSAPRGAFIRAQVELARLPPDHVGRRHLLAEEEALLLTNRRDWEQPWQALLPNFPFDRQYCRAYHRGFLHAI